jgi:transglutaminase-like putative cysteine protease
MDRTAVDVMPLLAHADTDWDRVARSTYVIRQSIRYEYQAPIYDLRQRLMVVPPARHGDQRTRDWGLDVSLEARRSQWRDRFANRVVDLEVDVVGREIRFEAWSLIERRVDEIGHTFPANRAWSTATPLTAADDVLADIARELAAQGSGGVDLAERICDWVYRHMTYRYDVTSIHTPAREALTIGAGVCQDYAHIALALCRQCGLPARYVSGHLLGEGGSHAWIEVMIPAPEAPTRWHSLALDPTHNRRVGLTYLTVATGRDYMDVAPMSGTCRATVRGSLTVRKRADLVAVTYRG